MKLLSILVPHGPEDAGTCRFLFDSIGSQEGVDMSRVEVVVCDDGPGRPDLSEALSGRGYDVRRVESPKVGVSGVRNRLMDEARGEYLMYCDADDGFCSPRGLALVFERLAARPDVVESRFMREGPGGSRAAWTSQSMVHGKAFSAAFARETGTRWVERLTHNEECVFVGVLRDLARRLEFIEEPFYVWRYNAASVSRREGRSLYCVKYFPEFMDANGVRRDRVAAAGLSAADASLSAAYYAYGFLTGGEYRNGTDEFRGYYRAACESVRAYLEGADPADVPPGSWTPERAARIDGVVAGQFGPAEGGRPGFSEWLSEIGARAWAAAV